ncbi:MAG: hypothetical protein H7A51_18600 [Akkermansiaceae bacterium]|nr:hypothetical protein [Akkermansiaceae bacterium]
MKFILCPPIVASPVQSPRCPVAGNSAACSALKALWAGVFAGILHLLFTGTALSTAVSAAEQEPATAENVAALVTQLSDESYLAREKAMEQLWRAGTAALPALRQAEAGNDPEAADRAGELVLYISAGVLFDSPDEVKALVVKFSRGDGEMKLVILRKLLELGQWKQVLHLALLEKDPEVRDQMADIVKRTAGQATREALARGDFALAGEILELTADDAQSLLMRAWFHARRGQLDEQLKKAANLPGKKGARWRMSLHRAGGNIPAAIREAEKAGEQKLADALRVLDGNAVPWLRRYDEQPDLDVVYSMGCRIQLSRLEGKGKEAALIARELARLAQDEDSTARTAICLAANGFRKEAVDLLLRQDVEAAFEYFDSIESPELCLQVLGIPRDAKPPYTDWVKKFTANAIEEEDDRLYHQLILLASFLVSHGEGQHAIAVLTPMMSALEADGSDGWFDLVSSMAIYGLGAEAVHFIEQRGNEDGEADLAVKKLLKQMPSKSLNHIWAHLKKRNNQDIGKALNELALLSGLLADPDNKTDKLHKALIDDVAAEAPEVKEERLMALFSFSIKRNDLALASRMADGLAKANDRWVHSKTFLDAALLRWKTIEPGLADIAKKNPSDVINLTKWYIALSKLDRAKEAGKVYDRVLLLSMGNAAILNRLGWELYEAGVEDKATELWLHAATLADLSDSEFDRAIVYLAHYGQVLYRNHQWKLASAIGETSTQLMMRGRTGSSVQSILRSRFYADFCKGMDLLKNGRKSIALDHLNAARQLIPGDGSLADEFFPILRKENIGKAYDQWFEDSYRHVEAACRRFPKAHNSHNTAAWLAARAVRNLAAAEEHAREALKSRPTQGAYLDTMAEVWFAKGDRKKAVEWSKKAVAGSVANAQGNPRDESQVMANYKQLHKQLERFENDPLPR